MFNEPVVYVDIETTGGSYRSSRIIEFAAIRVEHGEVTQTYQTLIDPGSPIPYHITKLTGITNHDVTGAPFFEEVAANIHEILDGAIFIAHHVRFDFSFIKRQLELSNISYNPRMLCSVRMSRALYPDHKGHGLEAIIKRFNIKTQARHRAYDDANAVKDFLALAYQEHGPELFAEAIRKQLRHQSSPPNLPSGAFDAIPNTPGVYTFSDSSGIPIYIGKSVTLRKRVMSHFSQDTAIDKEMKLSLNTHSISFVETASELEALLLESQMIKEQLPVYNRQLRRHSKMYVIKASADERGYLTTNIDFVDTQDITPNHSTYGAYSSRMKARAALQTAQKTYDLCPKLLGLEKSSGACFSYQLHKCYGACKQAESAKEYNQRFETAFARQKMEAWPYVNPIVVSHQTSNLVIDNWNVVGEIKSDEGCETLFKPWHHPFDLDTYKIIRAYLSNKTQNFTLRQISHDELQALNC